MELAGKLAVVTGGAEGIGAAIIAGLMEGGASIAAVDVKPIDLAALQARCGTPGQRAAAYRCDVTIPVQIAETCAAILADSGPASILVNNVGGSGSDPAPGIESMTDEIWEMVMALNLGAAMRFSRALVPGMKGLGGGRIINMSSTLKDGVPGPSDTLRAPLPYVTTKAALVGFTKQMAIELGPFGILVNCIAPGLTLPDEGARITQRFRALPPEVQARLTSTIALGRPAVGTEIASVARFLAGPASGYVSGQVIAVSGGP